MLAGYGAKAVFDWLQLRQNTRARHAVPLRMIVFIVISTIILFEYQFFWPMPTRSAQVPQAVTELHQRDDVRAVFNVPYQHLLAAKDALLLQTGHQLPLIAGQVSRTTPVNPAKLAILQETLNPALLQEAGADVVILHKQRAAEIDQYEQLDARLREQLGQPTYEDEQIAIFDVPQAGDPPQSIMVDEVPRPVTVDDTFRTFIYVSEPGLLQLTQTIDTEGVTMRQLLDSVSIHIDELPASTPYTSYVPLTPPGFYTLTYALVPPCPARYDETLRCRSLTLSEAEVAFTPIPPIDPVAIEGGITMAEYRQVSQARVAFWWQFDAPIDDNMVRFLHVINESGEVAAQNDTPIGTFSTGETWVEAVPIPQYEQLEPGTYTLRAGWYHLADDGTLTNLSVLTGDSAGQNSAEIATFTIAEP
jgi:hypothetical protein